MATQTKQTAYERALERAAQDGVCIVQDGGDHWQVRGSDGVTRYTVQATDDGLRCTCPSRHSCKHRAIGQQRLNEQQAAQEQLAAEATAALVLTERNERTLAGQTFRQEERLRALVSLPVAIAAYAVVLGPAHAWQWHQAKEEQWERYQAARLGGHLHG